MKRLLIPLLAAIALPNAVKAEPVYLTCTMSKDNRQAEITLNEDTGTVDFVWSRTGNTFKKKGVFNQTTVVWNTGIANWTIDRTNGKVYLSSQYTDTEEGICKKSEKVKTLF